LLLGNVPHPFFNTLVFLHKRPIAGVRTESAGALFEDGLANSKGLAANHTSPGSWTPLPIRIVLGCLLLAMGLVKTHSGAVFPSTGLYLGRHNTELLATDFTGSSHFFTSRESSAPPRAVFPLSLLKGISRCFKRPVTGGATDSDGSTFPPWTPAFHRLVSTLLGTVLPIAFFYQGLLCVKPLAALLADYFNPVPSWAVLTSILICLTLRQREASLGAVFPLASFQRGREYIEGLAALLTLNLDWNRNASTLACHASF